MDSLVAGPKLPKGSSEADLAGWFEFLHAKSLEAPGLRLEFGPEKEKGSSAVADVAAEPPKKSKESVEFAALRLLEGAPKGALSKRVEEGREESLEVVSVAEVRLVATLAGRPCCPALSICH